MIRNILYKKVDMTDDEYKEYNKICQSYTRPHFKGEELFRDLFETDDEGKIIYIKSLNNKQFSFEVMFFIMNLMQNQWLRYYGTKIDLFIKEANDRVSKAIQKIEENK